MWHRTLWHAWTAAVALGLAALLPAGDTAEAAGAGTARNCFDEMARGRGPVLTCELPTRLTEQERVDLRDLTGGRLQDARCVVSIRIDRRLVEDALVASDYVFAAPAQPVRCEVVTSTEVWPITATFETRVVLQGGVAIDASPGLANVEGVAVYLAWPVVQYVNRAPGIRAAMLDMINAYREQHQRRLGALGRRP